jgi:hypothetical protein
MTTRTPLRPSRPLRLAVASLLLAPIALTVLFSPRWNRPGPETATREAAPDPIAIRDDGVPTEIHRDGAAPAPAPAPRMSRGADVQPAPARPPQPLTPAPRRLVRRAADAESPWRGRDGLGVRSRRFEPGPAFTSGAPLAHGQKIAVDLPDGTSAAATVSDSFTNVNGTVSTTARVDGSRWGRVFLAYTGGELLGRIRIPERNAIYAIQHNQADGGHYVLQLDPRLAEPDEGPFDAILPPGTDPADAPPAAGPLAPEDVPPAAGDESVATAVVDVLVAYSNDALSNAGSVANMNNKIAIGMAYGNDAHANTDTGIVLHLVYTYNTDYTGSGNMATDLYDFTYTSSSYPEMNEVHDHRNTYGADFCVLMVGNGGGGIGWLLTSTGGSPSYAFCVVDDGSFKSYTPVHEIGHNMGLHHAIDQNYQPGPTGGSIGTDAAGWHWHPTADAKGYCSVMTYTGGQYFDDGLAHTRVGLFSDPDITDHGLPAGDNKDGNNARVLRLLKNVYVGYRDRPLPADSILVEYPDGGETLAAEDTYDIHWNSNGVTGNVRIELLQDGSLDRVVDAGTLNDRIYAWTIPADVNGSGYKIRIVSVDDGTIADSSDAPFSVYSNSIPPAAPTALTATAASSSQINLAWTDNAPNETGFKIERKTGAGGTYAQIATVGANVTTYQNTGLSASTTYYYRVRATNAAGDSAYSNEAGATTPQPPPPGPGTGITREWWLGITGTAVTALTGNAAYPDSPSGTQVVTNLFEAPTNWADNYGTRMHGYFIAPVTGAYTFYIASDDASELWLSTDTNPANAAKIAHVSGWTASRQWTKEANQKSAPVNLAAGGRYYIRALQKEGTGGDNLAVGVDYPGGSSEKPVSGSRLDPWVGTPPSAPTSLTATTVHESRIDLAWTDNATNETGFAIERAVGGGAFATLTTVGANTTAYTNQFLDDATAYAYRVRAVGAAGDSAWSNEAGDTTLAAGPLPAPWETADIGSCGVTGNASWWTDVFTGWGSGADIWGTADAFRFVYRPLTGDGEIRARVLGVENTNAWAKAGVMVRETLDANSVHAFMALTPGNGLSFQRRTTTGGTSANTSGGGASAPRWVRVTREGSLLTGYASTDGTTWTTVGSATIAMGDSVHVGLAVTSHDNAARCTARFDNVELIQTPVEVDVPLAAGYTLIGLPLVPETPLDAESLVQEINQQGGACTAVIRYADGQYETHPAGSSQAIFPIVPGEGYFIRCVGAGTWRMAGYRYNPRQVTLPLNAGYTLIALPLEVEPGHYTSESAAQEINAQGGSVTQILGYAGGLFVTHPTGSSQEIFELVPGEGYFIRSTGPSVWTVTK